MRRRRRRPRPVVLYALLAVVLIIGSVAALAPDKPSEEIPERAEITPEHTEPAAIAILVPEREPPEPERLPIYAGIELTEEDAYTLACLVYHEARGECFKGQVAVVEVVFNRILSDRFPDTVEEVVFQRYGDVWQFSPAPYLWTAEPGETQFRAVYTALTETEYNVTPETVYFSTAPYNNKISAIIGNHYFCEI
ncbi:MAG: cell wall hydrolase [Bacteroides sp.]|nr:cell wall hydrolase [Eubacterium sp.]MCM1419125.1 cell wall hydrolase [Roseburia sp.]MCM1463483.1 cell wall hydrolase [Bacteroides sp.]